MVRTQDLAKHVWGLLVERFGLLRAARRVVQSRQVVEAAGEIRVLLPEDLATNLQGLLVQRFGLLIPAH